MKYCKECGTAVPDRACYCNKCGYAFGEIPDSKNDRKLLKIKISVGIILILVITVFILFVTGIIGNKKNMELETESADMLQQQEQAENPSVRESPVIEDDSSDKREEEVHSENFYKSFLKAKGWKLQTMGEIGFYMFEPWAYKLEDSDNNLIQYYYPNEDQSLDEVKEQIEDSMAEYGEADWCDNWAGITEIKNESTIKEKNLPYIIGTLEMENWQRVRETENLYIYEHDYSSEIEEIELESGEEAPGYVTAWEVRIFIKNSSKVYSLQFTKLNYPVLFGVDLGGASGVYKALIETIQYTG